MKKLFYNAKLVTPEKVINNASVLVCDGVINAVTEDKVFADEKIDCDGKYLVAGFVDVHCHGGGGADFMDGSVKDVETAVKTHLMHGTTTIYPTTMSAPIGEIEDAMEVFRSFKKTSRFKDVAKGLHLEGPFISPKMCGAQRLDLIIEPTEKEISFLKDNADIISRISCAPEVNGVKAMAKILIPYGVQFSMGHTNATYEQAEDAVNNGFSSITHLYSATSGFHKVNQKVHIGVTQAAYGIEEIYAELIGDGCHVPKELLRLVTKIKGFDKVCLVTDAMRAAGTDVNESYLGKICPENRVIVDDGVAKLPDKSFFAGSIGTMDIAFKFAVKVAGLTLSDASKITSLTPATLMGIADKKGSIEKGKDADFILMDKNFNVDKVFVHGEDVNEIK